MTANVATSSAGYTRRNGRRAALLAGASALALVAMTSAVDAKPMGTWAPAPSAAAMAASQSSSQEAARVARDAQDSLKRATLAIQAMQSVQQAARDAARAQLSAISGGIPNGLGAGGLQIGAGVKLPDGSTSGQLWQGANLPTQFTDGDRTKVEIQQTQQKAILTWDTFNVGGKTDLTFRQDQSTWVALNRVLGTDGKPSQILGSINATGQVYVINQNGIIFGGASQVNVGALIASAAKMSDGQFLSGIYSTQVGSSYVPSFTDAGGLVKVEAGAVITTNAPASVKAGGGFVALLGSSVVNQGTITTPKGQVLLAAGDDFVLRRGYGTDVNQASTTYGNEIAPIIHSGSLSGTVVNDGLVFSQQGDITLAGRTIAQNGILVSTTSVNTRGTIHLLNSASDSQGSVTLGAASLTDIVPELDSDETALNSQRDALMSAPRTLAPNAQFDNLSQLSDRLDQSRIEIVTGGNVVFKGGSLAIAQGGQVAVSAGKRVFVEDGATIDVSGVRDVLLPMSANNIEINVQGNELRDSPGNRDNGFLANADVWIDVRNLILVPAGTGGYAADRYYTAGGLLEVGGYLANTAHKIGEWTAVGGTITLSAPEVIAQQGALFDISGGSVKYASGNIVTTNLLGADGRTYGIDQARADMTFVGLGNGWLRSNARWGITEVWSSLLARGRESVYWEPGYTVGRDAGTLVLSTPTSIFEGTILADVVTGSRQLNARPASVTDGYKLAQNTAALAGTLALGQYGAIGLAGAYATDVEFGDIPAVTRGMAATETLPPARANTAWFDASTLNSFKLGGVNVASSNVIAVDAPLTFAPGAQVKLVAPTVNIAADITAHSGSVTISNILTAANGTSAMTAAAGGAQLTLAAGVTIDTSGLWVNAKTNPDSAMNLAFLNGGNVTFDSTQNVTLTSGSVIDVSSGGAILANGKTQGGKGGNVTIKAGDAQQNASSGDGTLVLDGTIRAYGVTGGGALTISSPGNILIGDNAALAGGVLTAGTPAPIAVKLEQALTIPAGHPLPAALTLNFTTITFDASTPVAVTLSGDTWTGGPTGLDWILPTGVALKDVNGNFYSNNALVPAGTVISYFYGRSIPAGTVISSAVFPNGLAIEPYKVTFAAGSVQSTPMTYPAGYTIPTGAVLPETVAVAPAPALSPSFFIAGFSSYDINAGQGVLVANNTVLAPTMPVYQFTAASYAASTGSAPSQAMSVWTPPLYTENQASATLTQRGGASLTLRSQSTAFNGASAGGGSIVVSDGASVDVDPGQSITLNAFGQITVLGDLTAHGGGITLANIADGTQVDAARNFDVQGNGRGISIWVDANARLDVSGSAYQAIDVSGHRYGTATDGGSIAINGGGAFVLIRPGAELNADGAQTVIDLAAGGNARTPTQPLAWATNGGAIALSSSSGLYLDGDIHAAAGGATASGGSLSISLITPYFLGQTFPYDQSTFSYVTPANAVLPSTMVVQQQRPDVLSIAGPGTNAAALKFGQTTVSADKVKAGGFDSLTLLSGDYMQFSGDVSLALGRSLTLTAAAYISGPVFGPVARGVQDPSPPPINHVKLSAPYILFREPTATVPDGFTSGSIYNPGMAAVPTLATFEADANQIDIQGLVQFSSSLGVYVPKIFDYVYYTGRGFKDVTLVSQGDIRFLSMPGVGITTLRTDWNLELKAAQIYPATNVVAAAFAGYGNSDPNVRLTVGRATADIPNAPLSVFGSLALAAPIVEQGGVVRAPFGSITLGSSYAPLTAQVDLLPGSLTSVSMDGLVIPYGGTVDGVTYNYNGASVKNIALTNYGNVGYQSVITLDGQSVNVAGGAVLDMSGGGTLAGAGFVSGRGGSVNVLTTPLVNANPATPLSRGGDRVYAIVPSYASSYAPVAAENGAGDPAIGQQVTIPAGVPGLPAGTYTLLPSNYALLPGAYRVELAGSSTNPISSPIVIGNGTYAAAVSTGIANTTIQSSLPVTALITSGRTVRSYSQYNEQSYSDFLIANVAQFGGVRSLLPSDGKGLQIKFETPALGTTISALTFDGTALFQAAPGGAAGQVLLQNVSEIYSDASTATFSGSAVDADAINAIRAPRLIVNGYASIANGTIILQGGSNIAIRDGVTLKAGEFFLVGGDIAVGNNVTLTTIGQGAAPFDSASTGMNYSTSYGVSVLALSNGDVNFLANGTSNGAITIGAGSQLYSEGTLAFATSGASTIDPTAHFGSRNIALAVGTINIGSAADIAAAGNLSGLLFDQTLFNTLLNGDPLHSAPALKTITLSAASSINLFGSTSLDATGSGVDFVLNTSAIYGTGNGTATIAANKITWNGTGTATPPAIVPGGPGTGSGTFNLVADEIDLGRFVSLDTATPNRTIYGFNNVNLTANSRIVSAGNSKLFVYQAPSAATGAVFGQSGTGGNLTLTTPLLAGVQKSVMAYTAGGVLRVVSPDGIAPSAAKTTVSGAEIDLAGDSVSIASTILLPSGKLVVNATNDIVLDGSSRIDLSGQPSMIQTATVYGFGGTAIFNSAQGSVTQAAGSAIDVSAIKAAAGSVNFNAGNGVVTLGGALNGAATAGYTSGDFSVTTGTLSSSDFTTLNALLTRGGFFDARNFDIRNGDLAIGDGVKAHNVTVSTDGGGLTINGTIDASGAAPGTIRLSANNGLTLASTAVLDAHGNVLQVDSYGQPIEAKNRGHIELTAAGGTLTLSPGATMNLTTPNGMAYGDVVLNAQRTSEASGDIAINASGPLHIKGAYSIALNAFWTYDLPGGSTITQSTLDGYDVASTSFINAALTNGTLQGNIAGLSAYGSAYHLRPGVQITSTGDLSTAGNIDLAGYRYGPSADRTSTSATYGAGEPMDLVVRASGNLAINGSISDGFKSSSGTPTTYSPISAASLSTDTTHFIVSGVYYLLLSGNSVTVTATGGWRVPFLLSGAALGLPFQPRSSDGTRYASGSVVPYGVQLIALRIPVGEENSAVGLSFAIPGIPPAPGTSPAGAMLAPGSLSASIRLVAGADLAAADPRVLQTVQALNGQGNLTLNDPAYNSSMNGTFFSVLRTGTGNLDLLAGGNFSEATPYGVYTAGTQSASVLAADGSNPYDLVGAASSGSFHAWYPEHGGDLLLTAQQDVTGNIQISDSSTRYVDSDLTGNWLGRQGGTGVTSDLAAWWINFGSMTKTSSSSSSQQLTGFQGIGTLGGGNLTVVAGRNAGVINGSTGLDLAVASTGRVLADGTVLTTGGGDLIVKVGGVLNPLPPASGASRPPDYFGSITDLRGDIAVSAGSVGGLAQAYGAAGYTSYDPRAADPNVFPRSASTPGPVVTPGDGTTTITARGDLVLGGAADAGMGAVLDLNGTPYHQVNADGSTTLVKSGGQSRFTLWTSDTAINLYAAGGDVAVLPGNPASGLYGVVFYPGTLTAAAANGDIRFAQPQGNGGVLQPIELMPSLNGQLELMAAGSIFGSSQVVAMSGADTSTLATPLHPVWAGSKATNANPTAPYRLSSSNPIAFGADTPTSNLHAGDDEPARVYAGLDIVDLTLGQIRTVPGQSSSGFVPSPTTWYIAAKPFEVIAGRDIVGTGPTPSVFLNNTPADISIVRAGRDIFYQSVTIAGPGLLQVQAGRNLYQGYYGSLVSAGDVVNPANSAGGAGIVTIAGVGASGLDYTDFAKLYFNAANQLPGDGTPLAGSGKVAKTYVDELYDWLRQRFSPSQNYSLKGQSYIFNGSKDDALAFFLTLPAEQQGVFVRQVYYAELTEGGREYNNKSSSRYGSYLRGRQAIAMLFPGQDAQGGPVTYSGKITMFSTVTGSNTVNGVTVPVISDAGITTKFGGDIQILNPGGQTIIGVEGVTPGSGAGLITQGQGDINVYSLGSILLGQSRIMTTLGGNILAWSAEGDINAGRGSKTTTVFSPPKRAYDIYGNVTLSPTVPSTGAGIATLNPIPDVPPGNIDLIAPLGTIDAGEAGIRVSGNVNLAALQVINAGNIQVQGTSTGIPQIQAPNIGGLTQVSNTAGAAAQQAGTPGQGSGNVQPSIIIVEVLGFGGGSDGEQPPADDQRSHRRQSNLNYDPNSTLRVLGNGEITPEQIELLTDEEKRLLREGERRRL